MDLTVSAFTVEGKCTARDVEVGSQPLILEKCKLELQIERNLVKGFSNTFQT